jgi:hypothetical protein
MNANAGRARWARLVGCLTLLIVLLGPGAPPASGAPDPGSRFSFDVYRPGSYSEQSAWTWCTAASVQIIRNIARREGDHAPARQRRFFRYMRANNRFQQPGHRGVDPHGFEAGLRHFVDDRYRIVASHTYESAVRSAVTRLRQTGLPVALLVARGRHAWVLTGFTATADPRTTGSFRVLSVRVVGPLYGRQSVDGYDPPPDTSLSFDALRRFLRRYRFPLAATPWTGRFVTLQVIPVPLVPAGEGRAQAGEGLVQAGEGLVQAGERPVRAPATATRPDVDLAAGPSGRGPLVDEPRLPAPPGWWRARRLRRRGLGARQLRRRGPGARRRGRPGASSS